MTTLIFHSLLREYVLFLQHGELLVHSRIRVYLIQKLYFHIHPIYQI